MIFEEMFLIFMVLTISDKVFTDHHEGQDYKFINLLKEFENMLRNYSEQGKASKDQREGSMSENVKNGHKWAYRGG